MDIILKGQYVESRGIIQISKYYHPYILDQQAYNPVFSLNWGIPKMKDVKQCRELWSTCNKFYK